jgi:hypothetical protein
MQIGSIASRLVLSLALAGGAAALSGCSSLGDALGTSKAPPDEFAVLTAAPLIVPPDYNLRPPQPGAPSRNQQDPSIQARTALYTSASADGTGNMGAAYSDGEKALLNRSGAANVDPSIRRTLSSETGYDTGDSALTDRVLSGGGGGAAPAPAPAPASDAPQPAPTEPTPAPAAQPAPAGQ